MSVFHLSYSLRVWNRVTDVRKDCGEPKFVYKGSRSYICSQGTTTISGGDVCGGV